LNEGFEEFSIIVSEKLNLVRSEKIKRGQPDWPASLINKFIPHELLRVRVHAIPRYPVFVKLRLVPPWESIMKASSALIGLSNNIHRGDPEHNDRRREEVIKALGLLSLD
jgi:hypothetical protein